nr:transcriptional regulator BetI [uncultured Gellertiella sp.]
MPARPTRPKTRIEDIRRIELIDAAHRIFLKEGLKGLTTTRICNEAGMSQGILTYYFRDKEEVLFEMVRMNNRVLAVQVVRKLREANTGWERMLAIIDGLFPAESFNRPTSSAWVSLFAEAGHNDTYRRLLAPYYKRLRSNVASLLKPAMPAPEIDHFIQGFAAMIDGLWLRRAHSEADISLPQAKRLLVEYAEAILGQEVVEALKTGNGVEGPRPPA